MSVKTLTTKQLRGDLAALARMFPGGIPLEQNDRVNAIMGELKRRGEDTIDSAPQAPRPKTRQKNLDEMDDTELETELSTVQKALNRDPSDEDMQTRSADVRFEIRQRAKATRIPLPARSPLPPRALEIPEGVLDPMPASEPLVVDREIFINSTEAKNASLMGHIEKQHIKIAVAQTAAVVAARLLSEVDDINGDTIESACDTGVSVASLIFAKVGL